MTCLARPALTRRRALTLGAASALYAAAPLAQLRIEISGVGADQIPLALPPVNGARETGIDPLRVVASDLSRTGAFRLVPAPDEPSLEETVRPDFGRWRQLDVSVCATGSIVRRQDGLWDVRYRLFDVIQASELDRAQWLSDERQLRMTAHRIADRIYSRITGLAPLFASRLAYVAEHSRDSFELVVADSDGANAMPALRSNQPIISPVWSPDGRELAYVSFESQKPVVYLHTVATGRRRVLANFRGNNSAPAFSPDGRRLALALSREGVTQIFLINVDGTGVSRFSRSFAIDTEPVFSPDGRYIYFTSDRGGSPQIYRQPLEGGGGAERVTFAGEQSVSPTLSGDGATLAYVTRLDGRYRVTALDLSTRQETVLTSNQADESPCFSPNGQIIVYATEQDRRNVLATVSVDGRVHARLSGSAGDIREPSWGPLIADRANG